MINIHDLCIGNWVYDGECTQFPMFIRAIGEDYVYLDFEGNEGTWFEADNKDLMGITFKCFFHYRRREDTYPLSSPARCRILFTSAPHKRMIIQKYTHSIITRRSARPPYR